MKIRVGDFGGRVAPAVQGPSDLNLHRRAELIDTSGVEQALVNRIRGQEEERAKLARSRQAAELQDVIGRAALELGEHEVAFDGDTDFKTAPQRFDDGARKIREKHSAAIEDPVVRSAFTTEMQKLEVQKGLNVRKDSFRKERDYNQASLDRNLDIYATSAASSATPEERALFGRLATIAITAMQNGGWISAEEAGKKAKGFSARLDEQRVRRDITNDPNAAADALALDETYAANLDPVARARWTDTAYRRSESERLRVERAEEKLRKEKGNEFLSEAYSRQAGGTLTREYIEEVRPWVTPAEYKGLRDVFGKKSATEDNRAAFGDVQRLLYENPQEARATALRYHGAGQLTDATLSSVLSKSRELERSEGPKSPYERSRQFVANVLDPGPFSSDPAPKARLGLALKELDDWVVSVRESTKKDPEDKAIETKTQEVVKRYTLVDMADLARRSGLGAQPTPEAQLETVRLQGEKLLADREAKRITQAEFNRKMAELDKVRKAAEKARAAHGKP